MHEISKIWQCVGYRAGLSTFSPRQPGEVRMEMPIFAAQKELVYYP